jgi:predicted AlkP superfamily pyrophosphatase or phosphodiesterase
MLLMPAPPACAKGKAQHIVVVVWDGLRPDCVTERDTPTLFKLAKEGAFFQNHHAVFLSSTQVNGTAMATGSYPYRSGILANRDYRPAFDPLRPTGVDSNELIRATDARTQGRFIAVPTLAEIIRRAGQTTAIAGTKTVALLHDRAERDIHEHGCCVNVFAGQTLPGMSLDKLSATIGPFPIKTMPNHAQDKWSTASLTDFLWKENLPTFSLLWLSEPDYTQHATAPGSPEARAALKSSDDNLAALLRFLDQRKLRASTDIFVVADHGFSTTSARVAVAAKLRDAGFNARREFEAAPVKGDIVVAGNGGAVLLYVIERDPDVTRRVVEWLQQQDFPGVIATKEKFRGTLTLDKLRIHVPEPPDIVVSMRWTGDKSPHDLAGMLIADGNPAVTGVGGHHGSLSAYDMRSTLIAHGPDFRRGMVNQLPSGNVDLAPTVLWLLGIEPPGRPDGRILLEAIAGSTMKLPPIEMETLEASREFEKSIWQQYVRVTKFAGTVYFTEGNGAATNR